MPHPQVQPRPYSRAEYERMIELGVFPPGERVELIGGELLVAEAEGPAHYAAIRRAAKALEAAFGSGWVVRTDGPVALGDDSETEPDIAVLSRDDEDGDPRLPRPALIVEVAESTLQLDRERKGSLYARAGFTDYWVLDVAGRRLEVYREPVTDRAAPFGWRYGRGEVLDPSARVTPLAAPGASISLSALLPDAP